MDHNQWNALYARQSVDKSDSISVESQIEYCKYETHGEPYKVYSDRGYSGKNTERPQFLQMLSDVRSGKISRVICYKLDRCSRSVLDFTRLMEEFQENNVEFISCTEKFDTSTPMGRAMLSICVVFAQLERETIQQRILDAYRARCRRGFYMGGRIPFGFRLESHSICGKKTARYMQIPKEIEILRKMYLLYQDPVISQADVAQTLNTIGYINPRVPDGKWQREHIARLLKNPIYVKSDQHIYYYFLEQKVTIINGIEDFIGTYGCYRYRGGDSDCIVLAPHEGIIESDLWLRCANKNRGRHQNKVTVVKKET